MTNEEIILESVRKFESGNIAGLSELFDDTFIAIVPGIEPLNKSGLIGMCSVLKEAFPDFTLDAEVVATFGDIVKVLFNPTGTHSGVLRYPGITPVQPTGVSVALPRHLFHYTVKDNRIVKAEVEDTSSGGLFGLLRHLGVSISEDGDKIEG